MLVFFSSVHVLLCVFMIFVILLQPGKDAGMGAALGGGAASSAFGGRGAVTFLTKVTAVCAIAFFVSSLGLSFVGLRTSVAASLAATPAPASTPAPAAAPGDAPVNVQQANPGDAPAGAAGKADPAKSNGAEAVPAEKLPAQ
jgi:preprotein translocase subunit SecG